jgi:hypothetical protein
MYSYYKNNNYYNNNETAFRCEMRVLAMAVCYTHILVWALLLSCSCQALVIPLTTPTLCSTTNVRDPQRRNQHHQYSSRLVCWASTDPSIDDDEILFGDNDISPITESSPPKPVIPPPPLLGIGGKDGFFYDVNKLKRNLIQETVKNYKAELWDLLGTASMTLVEDKLAALVQANPISTMTDSNLLDRAEWCVAVKSIQPANVLFDTKRFEWQKTSAAKRQEAGAAETAFSRNARKYFLEDLDENESPFVIDETLFLGGLFARERTYNVTALTRTKLDLDITQVKWNVVGKTLLSRQYQPQSRKIQAVQILYVDSDLLISAEQGLDKPYTIYTKSPEWTARAQRIKRKLRLLRAVLSRVKGYAVGAMSLRKVAINAGLKIIQSKLIEQVEEPKPPNLMMVEIKGEGTTSLKVLKLGDAGGDDAWEGEDDPYVHLSADERQDLLKQMNVKELDEAGKEQQRKAEKEKKRVILERKRIFKKPDIS